MPILKSEIPRRGEAQGRTRHLPSQLSSSKDQTKQKTKLLTGQPRPTNFSNDEGMPALNEPDPEPINKANELNIQKYLKPKSLDLLSVQRPYSQKQNTRTSQDQSLSSLPRYSFSPKKIKNISINQKNKTTAYLSASFSVLIARKQKRFQVKMQAKMK